MGLVMTDVCVDNLIPSNSEIAGAHFVRNYSLEQCHLTSYDVMHSGVGVRIAIYIQVLIANVYAVLWSRFHHRQWIFHIEHCKPVVASLNSILVVGFALLVSSVIQASTASLEVYHAIIVLNMCWIISFSATMFIAATSGVLSKLFKKLHSSGASGGAYSRIFAYILHNLNVTRQALRKISCFILHRRLETATPPGNNGDNQTKMPVSQEEMIARLTLLYFLAAAHMCFTSAFGLWVFTTLKTFDRSTSPCTLITKQSFVGTTVFISDPVWQRFWIAMYVVAVIPIFNVFCHIELLSIITTLAFALGLAAFGAGYAVALLAGKIGLLSKRSAVYRLFVDDNRYITTKPKHQDMILQPLSLVIGLLVFVIIIASTELTIKVNNVAPGEGSWTFGQTLALLLTIPAFWDAFLEFHKTYKDRRGAQGPGTGLAPNTSPHPNGDAQQAIELLQLSDERSVDVNRND